VSEADLRTATTKRWAYMKARRRVSSKIVLRLPSTGEKSGYIESRTFKEPSRKVTRVAMKGRARNVLTSRCRRSDLNRHEVAPTGF